MDKIKQKIQITFPEYHSKNIWDLNNLHNRIDNEIQQFVIPIKEFIKSFHQVLRLAFILLIILFLSPLNTYCQVPKDPIPDGTTGEVFRPEFADTISSKNQTRFTRGNEWDGTVTTLKLTLGLMYDYGGFIQDSLSKQQIALE